MQRPGSTHYKKKGLVKTGPFFMCISLVGTLHATSLQCCMHRLHLISPS